MTAEVDRSARRTHERTNVMDVNFRGTAETITRQMLGALVEESRLSADSFRRPTQLSRLIGTAWIHWQHYAPEATEWHAHGTREAVAAAHAQARAFEGLAEKIRGKEIHVPAGVEPERVAELCGDLGWALRNGLSA